MRTTLTVMILTVTMGLFGQVQVQLHEGDHVYFLDSPSSHPDHYQIDENNLEYIKSEYVAMSEDGIPVCEIFFDPGNFDNITLRQDEDGVMYVRALADKLNPSVRAVNDDPLSQPVFQNGKLLFCPDRYLVIYTPHLARATSFKLATNNRVFVFVKKQSLTAKQL